MIIHESPFMASYRRQLARDAAIHWRGIWKGLAVGFAIASLFWLCVIRSL